MKKARSLCASVRIECLMEGRINNYELTCTFEELEDYLDSNMENIRNYKDAKR